MKVGEVDKLGRTLRKVVGKLVFSRSRQLEAVAICDTSGCNWKRKGPNAMGTGSIHASSKRHVVYVTRELVTEYDGFSPDFYDDIENDCS